MKVLKCVREKLLELYNLIQIKEIYSKSPHELQKFVAFRCYDIGTSLKKNQLIQNKIFLKLLYLDFLIFNLNIFSTS